MSSLIHAENHVRRELDLDLNLDIDGQKWAIGRNLRVRCCAEAVGKGKRCQQFSSIWKERNNPSKRLSK
jgi:hypothetical protein